MARAGERNSIGFKSEEQEIARGMTVQDVGSSDWLGDRARASERGSNLGPSLAGRANENLSSDPRVRTNLDARRRRALYLSGCACARFGLL